MKPVGPGTRDASESHARFRITRIMETLARQSGDLSKLVEVLSRDQSTEYHFLQIAEEYKKAGRDDLAVRWAEKGVGAFPHRTDVKASRTPCAGIPRPGPPRRGDGPHADGLCGRSPAGTVQAAQSPHGSVQSQVRMAGEGFRSPAVRYCGREIQPSKEPLDIYLESFGHSGFLCPVPADPLRFEYQLIIDRKSCGHMPPLHMTLHKGACKSNATKRGEGVGRQALKPRIAGTPRR